MSVLFEYFGYLFGVAANCIHVRAALLLWASYTDKPAVHTVPAPCDEDKWLAAVRAATRLKALESRPASEPQPTHGPYFGDETATLIVDIVRHAKKYKQPVVVPGTLMRRCMILCSSADNKLHPRGFSVQAIGVHYYAKFERVIVKLIRGKFRCPCQMCVSGNSLCVDCRSHIVVRRQMYARLDLFLVFVTELSELAWVQESR